MSAPKPREAVVETLKLHPDLARLPMLPEDHPDFLAVLKSVEQEGRVWTPLVLDENDLVIDGRHRLEAARRAGINSVPVVKVVGAEARQQVFTGLLARRHLSKSARGWLALSFLKECAARGKEARQSNLLSTKTVKITDSDGLILESALLELGVSEGTYRFALAAEKLLDQLPAKKKALREKIEAGIINGDIALNKVGSAIAGKQASENGRAPTDYYETVGAAFKSLENGFKNWNKLAPEKQSELYQEWRRVMRLIPENWSLTDLEDEE